MVKIAKEIGLWAVCIFLVYVFSRAGIAKFSEHSGWAHAFHVWGYPVWFRILVGCMECAAVLLLLYKRTAALGAALIIIVMLGAMATHAFIQHRPQQATNELFPLALGCIVFLGRMRLVPLPRRRKLSSSRSAG